ncbi:hypothetical protein GOODEAATRI_013241 [Goodea atripinnis]|uniref:Uncharacterized protein n=1 Tax=Goodea atripinnis TaxID=208336 RepID=A0ABV0MHE6_9TELE
MRGSKWDSIKPLLKILQESFPSCIHVALIIKPDNFWQKQRTNFGSSKFEFEMLTRLEEMQETVSRKDFPQDLEGARRMIEENAALKKKIIKAPIEELDTEGQRLLQRIQSSEAFSNRNGSTGGSNSSSSGGVCNADTKGLVPRITQLLDKLHSTRQHLHQAWHVRKLQLDQCFQLRLFEQDAEKVCGHGGSYTEIGNNHPHAVELQTQHNHFAMNCMNVYVNINRIVSVGSRLLESGHYASQQIKQISGQLEQEWKAFAAALDERSTLLEMSASFHKKCDQACGEVDLPSELQDLEDAIHHHQGLYEHITAAYSEVIYFVLELFTVYSYEKKNLQFVQVSQDGKALLDKLQRPLTPGNKLLEAAEQLAQTGECDPEEIYQAAHQLEDRIQDFVRRVEQRKVLLDMSVAFHTHVKEVGREGDTALKWVVGCVLVGMRAFRGLFSIWEIITC